MNKLTNSKNPIYTLKDFNKLDLFESSCIKLSEIKWITDIYQHTYNNNIKHSFTIYFDSKLYKQVTIDSLDTLIECRNNLINAWKNYYD